MWLCAVISGSFWEGFGYELTLALRRPIGNEARSRLRCGCPHRLRRRRLGLQEGDDGENATVGVGGHGEAELLEDARDVLLDAAFGQEHAGGDRRVRQPLRHQGEDLSFAGAQVADRVVAASPADELGDNARIERGAAFGHALDGGDEVGQVVDPVFQEVADAFGVVLEELERVSLLDVLGEDEHRCVGVALADLFRRAQPFVGVRRRHLDVDDRDVRVVRADLQQQIVSRAALPDDLESLVGEEAGDALAKEHRVVGEGDANRCLGLLGIGEFGVDAPYCRRNQSRYGR